jgi:predicted nucleic acid-binding protein
MYVLDTNVVSELRKARDDNADRNVTAWAIVVLPSTLFLSVISILELQRDTLLIERRDPAGRNAPGLAEQPCSACVRRQSVADRYRCSAPLCQSACP